MIKANKKNEIMQSVVRINNIPYVISKIPGLILSNFQYLQLQPFTYINEISKEAVCLVFLRLSQTRDYTFA